MHMPPDFSPQLTDSPSRGIIGSTMLSLLLQTSLLFN
jgi:hypothetical protein